MNETLGWADAPFASTPPSSTHGPHQDAQKLSTTGLPLNPETLTWSSYSGFTARFGACLPSSGGLERAACCRPHASESMRIDASATASPMTTALRVTNRVYSRALAAAIRA